MNRANRPSRCGNVDEDNSARRFHAARVRRPLSYFFFSRLTSFSLFLSLSFYVYLCMRSRVFLSSLPNGFRFVHGPRFPRFVRSHSPPERGSFSRPSGIKHARSLSVFFRGSAVGSAWRIDSTANRVLAIADLAFLACRSKVDGFRDGARAKREMEEKQMREERRNWLGKNVER